MDQKYSDQADTVIDRISDFVSAHPKTILVIGAVLVVLAFVL